MLEWYVAADRGVLFHLEDDGRVIGYCGGIRVHEPGKPGAFTSISQHGFWVLVTAYLRRPWLIIHPENFRKSAGIFRNILIRMGLRQENAKIGHNARERFRANWGLVVIGVRDDCRHRGYGSQLLQHFEQQASADGAEFVRLSVKADNTNAISAYERNGWKVSSRRENSLQMQKSINNQ